MIQRTLFLLAAAILITVGIPGSPASAFPWFRFVRELFSGSDAEIAPTRGGINPMIPYTLSPRNSQITEPRPLLRWNAVPEANQYTLTLRGPEGVVWRRTVGRQSELRYPGEPPLVPEVDYVLVVETDMGVSSAVEAVPGLSFRLMSETMQQAVSEELAQVTNSELDEAAQRLAQVDVLQRYYLLEAAIAELEAAPESIARSRRLGELYLQTQLALKAQTYFEQALVLAEAEDDLRSQADLKAFLGYVALELKRPYQGMEQLQEAQALYEQLGLTQQAEMLSQWLAAMSR